MHRLVRYFSIIFLLYLATGCGKVNNPTTIYGTVFNSVTHEPVIGAEVEYGSLRGDLNTNHYTAACHKVSSSVSGSDGQFELQFTGVHDNSESYTGVPPKFYIYVTCAGYSEYFSMTSSSLGGSHRMDINLKPKTY